MGRAGSGLGGARGCFGATDPRVSAFSGVRTHRTMGRTQGTGSGGRPSPDPERQGTTAALAHFRCVEPWRGHRVHPDVVGGDAGRSGPRPAPTVPWRTRSSPSPELLH